ncbi:hypothetical protein ROZALSC1DRAFT_29475 [Rozella allomycis CSF55]|uniref:Uncharacterized protein n=1 Tax=Rozella allomycis (strain CSF55) TaxID=988480 RepID=A0A075AY72_ROZAC|nr:hypothetical protein O9G_000666 [Rozella allomycis CSF55]RKP18865.1 hypothetical protein ROZALSC1DRAFT_29475 [Rozella allomycis CSF55]|eukprot:EPZ35270.1 hypothetical protein O9G_000666 [Rozella allomycis CSF55]
MKKQLGVTPEYKRNIPKGRYRISQDEKMKLEDLVKQGKSVGEILDIIEQEHRDGLWDRCVSKSTVIRIYRDHQK